MITAIGGSSPRVRGTHEYAQRIPLLHRFIPACAGNTTYTIKSATTTSVHPRVCGEHDGCGPPPSGPRGSSPRVRGTRKTVAAIPAPDRFIPACAGNTNSISPRSCIWTVHPRVCGEHHDPHMPTATHSGSSPRVRGTRVKMEELLYEFRFIPACAGNTRECALSTARPAVHPRVCGEHARAAYSDGDTLGSSPRVRGTPKAMAKRRPQRRFIPACAGNTAALKCVGSPR